MEQFKKNIQSLAISDTDKDWLLKQLKIVEKNITIAEFKYNRTLIDKAAITNVLNASIQEIEIQKKNIEAAKNEINQNLIELDAQKKIIEVKNAELNKALTKLKSTQSQLIQSEKMASLGELTAGVAHEIQNPLNFVNNFSEVSSELIEELHEEMGSENLEEEVKLIIEDLKLNLEKINTHGKRASGIVKGMLQHSRTSEGEKELTDINDLADEYLRLAFHGLRAKDNTFNADFKLELDKTLPKLNVVPQDIGRVLLNLINNAFYVVDKKVKENTQTNYKPLVTVSTESSSSPSADREPGGQRVKITVSDNGSGIPNKIKHKIFQPFFTTKPTGSGTGLGLSLSYDIIQAHGGSITLESTQNSGTEFTITLPTNG